MTLFAFFASSDVLVDVGVEHRILRWDGARRFVPRTPRQHARARHTFAHWRARRGCGLPVADKRRWAVHGAGLPWRRDMARHTPAASTPPYQRVRARGCWRTLARRRDGTMRHINRAFFFCRLCDRLLPPRCGAPSHITYQNIMPRARCISTDRVSTLSYHQDQHSVRLVQNRNGRRTWVERTTLQQHPRRATLPLPRAYHMAGSGLALRHYYTPHRLLPAPAPFSGTTYGLVWTTPHTPHARTFSPTPPTHAHNISSRGLGQAGFSSTLVG